MEYDGDLFNKLKYRNDMRARKIYRKKEYPILKNKDLGLYQRSDDLIKIKVDDISKEIANKYKIEEEKIYDTLYLKVRKMFLELM